MLGAQAVLDVPLDATRGWSHRGNDERRGVDLVAALLEVATGRPPPAHPDEVAGVRTHQPLVAVLGNAQAAGRRPAVFRTATDAIRHRGSYQDSSEELTPRAGDIRAVVPLASRPRAAPDAGEGTIGGSGPPGRQIDDIRPGEPCAVGDR